MFLPTPSDSERLIKAAKALTFSKYCYRLSDWNAIKMHKSLFYLSKYGSCLSIDWFLRPNLTIIFQKMSISRQAAVALLFCIFWFFQWYFSSSSQFFWWDYWLLLTFSRLISSVFETLFWLMLTGVMRRLRRRRRKMKTGIHTEFSARKEALKKLVFWPSSSTWMILGWFELELK